MPDKRSASNSSQVNASSSLASSSVSASPSSVGQVFSSINSQTSQRSQESDYSSSYLDQVSSNASSANDFFAKINDISSEIAKSSTGISSIFAKMSRLNDLIGLDQITISDHKLVSGAAQSVAIDMIKVNNQKIRALTAKNGISGMSFQVKLDYRNFLKAQKAIQTDVTGINTHMSKSNMDVNQGISTLSSHNSLVTSYSDQLSYDIDNSSKKVSSASVAASKASLNQLSASAAYRNVSGLVDRFQQQVASTAYSNAGIASSIASGISSNNQQASNYRQQVSEMAVSYSDNSMISSANSLIKSDLQTINVNHHFVDSAASNAFNRVSRMNSDDVDSLGADYQEASQAASETSDYQGVVSSAMVRIASVTSTASSVASSLHAERAALQDGASDYMPVASIPHLDSDHDPAYLKYYKRGYRKAGQGFYAKLHQIISDRQEMSPNHDLSYRIGFKDASYFVKGVNDARKRIIKNNQFVNVKHYNSGYDSYRQFIHSNVLLDHHKKISVPLKQSLLLVIGFLIGSRS